MRVLVVLCFVVGCAPRTPTLGDCFVVTEPLTFVGRVPHVDGRALDWGTSRSNERTWGADGIGDTRWVVDWEHATLGHTSCDDATLAQWFEPFELTSHPIPTVTLRIGTVTAPAQLDTGYDDALAGPAVNVNRALFEALAPLLVRVPERDVVLSTCVADVRESVQAYRLPRGMRAELVGLVGTRARADVVLFLKETPAAARACGGIGTWREPAAQLGVSWLADTRQVIIDQPQHRLWLRRE